MNKLPPYGSVLKDRLQHEISSNDVYIFIGDKAWKKAEAFQAARPGTLCLPPWQDPDTYTWPVYFCDILIWDTSYAKKEYVEDLVIVLYKDGARIVRSVSSDFSVSIYKRDF